MKGLVVVTFVPTEHHDNSDLSALETDTSSPQLCPPLGLCGGDGTVTVCSSPFAAVRRTVRLNFSV